MKIFAVTGGRSDYDLLGPVLEAIEERPGMDLVVFAACAHLSCSSGCTVERISGFRRTLRRPTLLDWDRPEGRLKSMGLELIALAQDLEECGPDLVLVLGDREDALLGAAAARYSWIPVAHIFGGDLGCHTVDDDVRHAVTMLSQLHFAASRASAENLVALGEAARCVHFTGNPALDRLRAAPSWSAERLGRHFGIDTRRPAVLVCQHPLGPDRNRAEEEMNTIIDACAGLEAEILVNDPNSDPGRSGIAEAIDEAPLVTPLRNVPREAWTALLKHVDLMLGNSSAGIFESSYLGIPAVNVGPRQLGREQAGNVEFVEPEAGDIRAAARRALFDEEYRARVAALDCPFGDGRAAERIVDELERTEVERLLPKRRAFQRLRQSEEATLHV